MPKNKKPQTANTHKSKLGIVEIASVMVIILSGFTVDLSSDIISPAIPLIQNEFNTSIFFAESIIATNILWLSISALVYGILSDNYGRKKLGLTGCVIFILGTLLSFKAKTIGGFIIGRNIQGIGSGFSIVIGITALRDMFQGKIYIQINSIIAAMLLFVPSLAPILGSVLTVKYGWKSTLELILVLAIFCFILICMFFKETRKKTQAFSSKNIILQFKKLCKERAYILGIVINSLSASGIWLIINFMPYILQNQFGLSINSYGKLLSLSLLSGIIGALLNGYLIRYISATKLLIAALSLTFFSGITLFSSNYVSHPLIYIVISASIFFFSIANVFSIISDIALKNIDIDSVGLATSMMVFAELMISGISLLASSYIANFISSYTTLTSSLVIVYAVICMFLLRKILCNATT